MAKVAQLYLLRERDQLRRVFARHVQTPEPTEADLDFLNEKIERLDYINNEVHKIMLATEDYNENEFAKEYDECSAIKKSWYEFKSKMVSKSSVSHSVKGEQNLDEIKTKKTNLKLPKIEIFKFDDNPKSWITFWSQFSKIHEDTEMQEQDKFQYLLQSMAEGSKSRTLVEGYPPTKENYSKVIDMLKSRFAKDEVLVDIYVRELLNLVTTKNKLNLDILYDKIIVNLQILNSLGIFKEKYECILLPLIESALPDKTLILWSKTTLTQESKLNQLLEFLKKEVEAEERCRMAKVSFGSNTSELVPTASCLVSKEVRQVETPKRDFSREGKEKELCYFCDKPHNYIECNKANNLSLVEKKNFIKQKGGCYICLKKNHLAKFCRSFIKCMFCNRRHLIILCPELHRAKKPQTCEQKKELNIVNKPDNIEVTNHFTSNNCTTLLQTLVVKIISNNQQKHVRALLDSGSQRTYVKSDLINELGLKVIGSESIGHSLFSGVKKNPQIHRLIDLRVSSLDNSYQTSLIALEQDLLCCSLPKVQNPNVLCTLKKYNIFLTDTAENMSEISILIGSDYLGSILNGNLVHITDSLVAIPTKLGWTLQGPIQNMYNTITNINFVSTIQDDNLEFMWSIESLGIKDPYEKESSEEILKLFNDNVSVNTEGRYEVGLLWKEGPKLESNYDHAYRRLMSTTKKLENLQKLKLYNEVFEEWKKDGIIEMVAENDKHKGHYLPHHAVFKLESNSTQIRPVFDASCQDKNMNSLNKCIEKGTNLMEVIPKLLIMFRAGMYGITADIKKAFLQISVKPPDRRYLKLLWWKDIETKRDIVTYQHTRVPFGIACSPFLLAATIDHHLEKYKDTYPDTAKILKESFYVDNCVTSFNSEKERNKFRIEATELMKKGKFELRDWMTNSKDENDIPVSVLGIQWNKKKDDICCVLNLKSVPLKITKRDLLSITQQIFDPVGFLSPVTLIPKLIIQRAWMLKTGWDERIPPELEIEYKNWLKTINCINQCKVPRSLADRPLQDCKVSIHVFCDASKSAYAGSVFIRSEYERKVTVRLITAKSRVAPIKSQITLPRLELMGALIASRLYREIATSGILHSLKDYRVYCWTDSSVVLAWLKHKREWKLFVSNRVKEISKNTNVENWRHLPSQLNPADLLSRGCNAKKLLASHWWEGPEWLLNNEDQWPVPESHVTDQESELIVRQEEKNLSMVNIDVNLPLFSSRLTYFSKYNKIVRLVAWILRMNPILRKRWRKSNDITSEEYLYAEKILIKLIQGDSFNMDSLPKNLNIFLGDEGIIRVKTRLELSHENTEFVNPILLPGKNSIVERLIRQRHLTLKHAGTQLLLSNLRNDFWILNIRRVTKKIIAECVKCKRFKSRHYAIPEAQLPSDRLDNVSAFQTTGIDLAGPLFLRDHSKCWIALFTCATYRAVHLELVESLSTSSFLMSLRRFIARRGRVSTIYTDNGTNFQGAANLLKEVNWTEVEASTATLPQVIKWKFLPPASPWWGGWWERLVRVLKEMLRRILGGASLTW